MHRPTEHVTTGCVTAADLFQDRLIEEPPAANAPATERRRYVELVHQAARICTACPLQAGCLYRAVTTYDVNGYVGGTTQRQRAEIRRRLGIRVDPEDFDTLAGVTAPNRQVDHAEVVRLRKANPDETLENIARRLGCSLSTVKRHLRRARDDAGGSTDRSRGDDSTADDSTADDTVCDLNRVRSVSAAQVMTLALQVVAVRAIGRAA